MERERFLCAMPAPQSYSVTFVKLQSELTCRFLENSGRWRRSGSRGQFRQTSRTHQRPPRKWRLASCPKPGTRGQFFKCTHLLLGLLSLGVYKGQSIFFHYKTTLAFKVLLGLSTANPKLDLKKIGLRNLFKIYGLT